MRELDYKEPLATKRFVVKEGELVGIYQTKKGLAVPIKYKRVRSITTNELPCYAAQDPKTSKWALLSPTAKQLTDFEYNTINVHYKTKKIIVMKDGKKGELDHEGKVTWIE